jgi:hypothetical protein
MNQMGCFGFLLRRSHRALQADDGKLLGRCFPRLRIRERSVFRLRTCCSDLITENATVGKILSASIYGSLSSHRPTPAPPLQYVGRHAGEPRPRAENRPRSSDCRPRPVLRHPDRLISSPAHLLPGPGPTSSLALPA